jgi:GDP-D-mannose dehydratase
MTTLTLENTTTPNKKVLIFGCNSQLGKFIVPFLLKRGMDVIGVSRSTADQIIDSSKYITGGPRFTSKIGDVQYPTNVANLVSENKPFLIINLASVSSPTDCYKNKRTAIETNTIGVFNILEAIKHGSPESLFINFGSVNEMMESRKLEFYSATKAAARTLIHSYRKFENIRGIQMYIGMNTSELGLDINVEINKVARAYVKSYNAILRGHGYSILKIKNVDAPRYWAYSKDIAEYVANICTLLTPENITDHENRALVGNLHSIDEFIYEAGYALNVISIRTRNTYVLPFKEKEYEVFHITEDTQGLDSPLNPNDIIIVERTPFSEMVKKMISACPV